MRVFLCVMMMAGLCFGEEYQASRRTWWKASLAVLAASTAVDAASSWGRLEANPFLRNADGRFGVQGVAVKAAMFGGVAGVQYLLLRNRPKQEKWAVGTNLILSGTFAAAAASNYHRGGVGLGGSLPQPWPPINTDKR